MGATIREIVLITALALGALEAGEEVLLRARWTEGGEKYLYDRGAVAAYGHAPTGNEFLWQIETSEDGWLQLRNSATGDYLGAGSKGGARCEANEGGPDQSWRWQAVAEGWHRLQHRNGKVLHCEGQFGTAELGGEEVEEDWWSAMWEDAEVRGAHSVQSPDGKNVLTFRLEGGVPKYRVLREETAVVAFSKLGFLLKDLPSLAEGFELKSAKRRSWDENWKPVWGQSAQVRDHGEELLIELVQTETRRQLNLIFRAYDDGVAFRYHLPEQEGLKYFEITSEETHFELTADHESWWVEDEWDSYERDYNATPVSQAGAEGANTPLTMRASEGLHLSIHEADLTDWAGMTLKRPEHGGSLTLKAELVPWFESETKVKGTTPHHSPWRTIQLAPKAGGLIESNLILNLNDPCLFEETEWIKPAKFLGIWWGMITGVWTWDREIPDMHGATNERTKRYIDACARLGIPCLLVEGWNQGWEGGIPGWGDMSMTKPYEDFDLPELARYAATKGVSLMGHHETGGNIANYLPQMEEAFAYYRKHGINRIKTGYVSGDVPVSTKGLTEAGREHHHGQYQVNHYQHVVETAAKYEIMINAHEPIKPTGKSRTFPNFVAREGARGGEFNHFVGNPPGHTTILPFTRLLGGPMDYTPGLFDCGYKDWGRFSTRANQLALFVVIWSPLQMAADHYQAYENESAFQFIRNVPVGNWDETRVLDAVVGDHVVIARRQGTHWYLGAVGDELPRTLSIPMTFLAEGQEYEMVVYEDAADADYEKNPNALNIRELQVTAKSILDLNLARGGGAAVEIYPLGSAVPKPAGNAGKLVEAGGYLLRAKHSSRLATSPAAVGGSAYQAAARPGRDQDWTFRQQDDGTWLIASGLGLLSVESGATANGAGVVVISGEPSPEAHWHLEHISGSFFWVVNAKTGKCLDVAEGSYAEGGLLHQWEKAYGPNQVWSLESVESD